MTAQPKSDEEVGFLKVHVYGPYRMNNRSEMTKLCEYVIGLSMHLAEVEDDIAERLAREAEERAKGLKPSAMGR